MTGDVGGRRARPRPEQGRVLVKPSVDRPFIRVVQAFDHTMPRPEVEGRTMIFALDMTSGQVLLLLMKELQPLSDAELRDLVRTRVTSAAARRTFERLSENASHDTLLLLSARALAHQMMQTRR